jgi:pimeloyl-ACP methyl ester carboxylesterase
MEWGTVRWAGTHNIKLPYVEQGAGDPLVLVHGSNSDYRIWNRHRAILASQHRVISPSQRYFGDAPWTDNGEQFSISVLSDDLASFVEGLNVGPVNVVGWSFGGAVSMVMGVRHPTLIRRMFLYEPSLSTFVTDRNEAAAVVSDRSAQTSTARRLAASGDLAGAVRALMDGVNDMDGAFNYLPPEVQKVMIDNARMLPLMFAAPPPPSITADDLKAIGFPLTIGVGAESRIGYRIAARTAGSLVPGAGLVEVERARHLWPVQDPEGFSRLVLKSLEHA